MVRLHFFAFLLENKRRIPPSVYFYKAWIKIWCFRCLPNKLMGCQVLEAPITHFFGPALCYLLSLFDNSTFSRCTVMEAGETLADCLRNRLTPPLKCPFHLMLYGVNVICCSLMLIIRTKTSITSGCYCAALSCILKNGKQNRNQHPSDFKQKWIDWIARGVRDL